ncbi:MAG: helix-turn-helix domain-containing protein [Phenylobacterium sp.]|nr:helix-turn-helix domain-containing protein [Phenylobacterium sp.]
MKCRNCEGQYKEYILPEHMEDVGGIEVLLRNTVHVRCCEGCDDEQTMIPDLRGLVRAVAMMRAAIPIRLGAGDIRLMRRALDLTQKEFAQAMDITPETVSRWESADSKGVGGYADKLVRQNVCALIHAEEPGMTYDAAAIAKMQVGELIPGAPMPLIEVELVTVKTDGARSRVWDAQTACIAA